MFKVNNIQNMFKKSTGVFIINFEQANFLKGFLDVSSIEEMYFIILLRTY